MLRYIVYVCLIEMSVLNSNLIHTDILIRHYHGCEKLMTRSHVGVTNAEYKNRNFDFFKMTSYRKTLKDSCPLSKFPKIDEYKSQEI